MASAIAIPMSLSVDERRAMGAAKSKWVSTRLIHDNAEEHRREYPARIVLEKTGDHWTASGGSDITSGYTPEEALHRLFMRISVRGPNSEEEVLGMCRLYRASEAPSCDVDSFRVKPALDGQTEYLVGFHSNNELNRGDFERVMCNGMRTKEDRDVTQGTDGCDALGRLSG
jgi:hypothetical protein